MSFEEILSKPSSDIKPPPAYPTGSYHCLVDGPPEHVKSSQKATDGFRFKYRIQQPLADVDQALAQEVEGGLSGKIISDDVWVTEASAWRLKELLTDHLGIAEEGKTLREQMSEAPGKQLIVVLKHEASQDGKRVFHRVAQTSHV